MSNLLNKMRYLVIAPVLASTALFAQQANNGNNSNCRNPKMPEPMPAPTMAAYNAPARTDVRGAWDFSVDASFIYWQPQQDNLEFAMQSSSAGLDGTATVLAPNYIVPFNPSYKPGFQIGGSMAYDWDNWDSAVEYTWFHNTNTSTVNALSGGLVYPTQEFPDEATGSAGVDQATASWNLKMDLADWQIGRSYYMGTKLTMRPYFGIRGAWIRQKFSNNYYLTGNPEFLAFTRKSTSWGVGPSLGLNTKYLFGYGLRMFGDFMTDLLYSRYSTSYLSVDGPDGTSFYVKERGQYVVRPHTSLDLGFAWASYFDNNNWHFDLMASYGFQVFWNQNMFLQRNTNSAMSGGYVYGNLYVQGLTLTAKFDF